MDNSTSTKCSTPDCEYEAQWTVTRLFDEGTEFHVCETHSRSTKMQPTLFWVRPIGTPSDPNLVLIPRPKSTPGWLAAKRRHYRR